MKVNPYLQYNGRCKEAFEFYQKCIGGEVVTMTYGETPAAEHMPAEMKDAVIHARLTVGGAVLLMGCDAGEMYKEAGGFSITLGVDTAEDAERIFAALSENGTVGMPMEETFFAIRWGSLTDQFGMPWMVICEKPMM